MTIALRCAPVSLSSLSVSLGSLAVLGRLFAVALRRRPVAVSVVAITGGRLPIRHGAHAISRSLLPVLLGRLGVGNLVPHAGSQVSLGSRAIPVGGVLVPVVAHALILAALVGRGNAAVALA